jgi:hypothetical protein
VPWYIMMLVFSLLLYPGVLCWAECKNAETSGLLSDICHVQTQVLAQALSTIAYTEQGWPKIVLQVDAVQSGLSEWMPGRLCTTGYAVVLLPCTSGMHDISVPCIMPFYKTCTEDRACALSS